jgi:exonuclease VII small subunit
LIDWISCINNYYYMKDKNLPPDNSSQSLEELTKEANNIIESLEKEKNLQNSIDSYQKLLKLNNIIEKKFKKNTRKINEETKKKINNITSKKNEK